MTFRPLQPPPIRSSIQPGVPESGDSRPHLRSCPCPSTWYIATAGVVHVTDAAATAGVSALMAVANAITPAASAVTRSGSLRATVPLPLLGCDTLILLVRGCLEN